MEGTPLNELYELISYRHEAEFTYKSKEYVLLPEDGYLIIQESAEQNDNPQCLCRKKIPEIGDIPKNIIDAVFSEKCFDGKSFLEIEQDITVTCIL